jgi:hypothetical protein
MAWMGRFGELELLKKPNGTEAKAAVWGVSQVTRG